jgi:hypothetical protein
MAKLLGIVFYGIEYTILVIILSICVFVPHSLRVMRNSNYLPDLPLI